MKREPTIQVDPEEIRRLILADAESDRKWRPWEQWERDLLVELHDKVKYKILAKRLNRSIKSVHSQLERMGLMKSRSNHDGT